MEKIRMTQMAKTAGCAAKIPPKTLAQVLGGLPKFHDENLLVGFETSDDAAVYRLTDELALIQTVDFFTPVVDDPYTFGQVAAANALSDVYAMGGVPKVALNIVAFPNCMDPAILEQILLGGSDKVREAGAVLVGGHSVQDDEPKYGLCVSGLAHPDRILKNYGCRPGDVLILTKPIGSGILNTAVKAGMASERAADEVARVMSTLNRYAAEVIADHPVHACTDVTGFGLLGHCSEMAKASDVTFDLRPEDIAYFDEAADYAQMGLVPAGAYRNREHIGDVTDFGEAEEYVCDLLCDPQTSGGLLVSADPADADALLRDLRSHVPTAVSVVGTVSERREKLLCLQRAGSGKR